MITWRVFTYGNENPSRSRRFAIHSLLIFTAFIIYGYNCNFAVSPIGADLALYACIFTTTVLAFYLWYGYGSGKIPFAKGASYGQKLLVTLVIPPVLFVGFWVIFSKAIPNIAAIAMGQQSSLAIELEKSEGRSRKQCKYQLRGPYLKPPSYICVDAGKYSRLPTKGIITVRGKSTIFGMHITDVES